MHTISGEEIMEITNNNKQVQNTGWPLLVTPDADGQLHYPDLKSSVRQSIEVILRTKPGEQLMRPQFGAGLEDYLHQPNTLTTRQEIHSLITESLKRWEPRIKLNRVEVWESEEIATQIHIEIAYQILNTGQDAMLRLNMDMRS